MRVAVNVASVSNPERYVPSPDAGSYSSTLVCIPSLINRSFVQTRGIRLVDFTFRARNAN